MNVNDALPRIGLLWRADDDPEAARVKTEQRLGPLIEALRAQPSLVEHLPYTDDAIENVRAQLLACDVVLVWANPIHEGRNRARLDTLLREVSGRGVIVSAHPDTIVKLGTKEVLYRARHLLWGSDVELYEKPEDFARRFPARLASYGRLVVKQGRGNGGNGVWSVELATPTPRSRSRPAEAAVTVRDAQVSDGSSEQMALPVFLALATDCFGWSSCLIDQPFQDRLVQGMLRCYFSREKVVGFARQWPRRGLLGPDDARAAAIAPATIMEPSHAPAYQRLRGEAEAEWLPALMQLLDLQAQSLPLIWDADFLFGPPTTTGEDTYVLCEINTSSVWPFPPTAAAIVAGRAVEAIRTQSAR